MRRIRTRVILLLAISLSSVCAFSFLTYSSFKTLLSLETNYEESYKIVDNAFALQQKQLSQDDIAKLKITAEVLNPEFRSRALNEVIRNTSTHNIQFLLRAEGEFRKHTSPLIKYFQKRTIYFAAIAFLFSTLFVVGMSYFTFGKVFSPLQDLSNKMTDFINNRYSYEFSIPESNEIGDLHSKFNSMAQNVLSQIEELQALDKAKNEFLSIASHELRTPLTSIKGSLRLLNAGVAGKMNEASQKLMTIALDETERLIRIINELLDLAKIEARQFPLNKEWAHAQNICSKTFASLQGFCEPTDIKLKVTGDKEFDIFVDMDRCQQIMTNLLSNAIKYSPPGETVTVTFVREDGGMIQVEVSDRGRGISPEDQEIIFEKFRQATNSQNPLVKGTGLGLAIAKALIEQHGGTIGVRSTPGEGSTFYFTLPEWRKHPEEQEAAA